MKPSISVLAFAPLAGVLLAQTPAAPPSSLPATGVAALSKSLQAATAHPRHLWRDTPAINPDGTINGYVEIARGDRRKWEFDMARHQRAIDRVLPEDPGGYPVNYGFVPQTVSYDGDPFDVLVLGPAQEGGTLVRGVIVGLLHMTDEKGLDSKVVLSMADPYGKPDHDLTDGDRQRIGDYFKRYKRHEPGKFSIVHGWDARAQGLAFVHTTHAFFRECRRDAGSPCHVRP
jgi:inorganic pyrophosphatase